MVRDDYGVINLSQWLKCKVCEWEWRARIAKPKSCPRCKTYRWEYKVEDIGLLNKRKQNGEEHI